MHECFREAEMDEKEEIKSQERHHGDGKKEEKEEHLYIEVRSSNQSIHRPQELNV